MDDGLQALNKDIGKLAERVGRLEVSSEHARGMWAEHMEREHEVSERIDKRLAKLEAHSEVVCTFARVGVFFMKWLVPFFAALTAIAAGVTAVVVSNPFG